MNVEPKFLKGKTPYIIIALTGLAVYGQTLFFGFTYFDDNLLMHSRNYSDRHERPERHCLPLQEKTLNQLTENPD